jgi:[protein-PII] uridylyltransferase
VTGTSSTVRAERDALVDRIDLVGATFGGALSELVDRVLVDAAREFVPPVPWALVALGSYGRRELSPGSDVDVMLLYSGGRQGRAVTDEAGRFWYPLWDAGFVLGQSVRTPNDAIALVDDDLDAMTALLDLRLVAGDSALTAEVARRVRELAVRRRTRLVDALADASARRLDRPGPIAEMLEPNLKDGGGGLRDLQSPGWVGWSLAPGPDPVPDGWEGGVARLVSRGYLQPADPDRLRAARSVLLDVRLALHRANSGKSDQLPLQDQDAVARGYGATDADALVRTLGEAARSVVWITSDMWARLRAAEHGPAGLTGGVRPLGGGVVLRDGRIAFATEGDDAADVAPDATRVLAAAAHAARLRVPFERQTLSQIAALDAVVWTPDARDAFLSLLAAGRGAVAVFEALDHVGVLVKVLPEWERVRALPQRNAYHRFTVDRHLLEAVAECAALLDPEDAHGAGFDGQVARRARADVLLLAALLHDIGKGMPGDHSVVGTEAARAVALRLGVDDAGVELLVWAVRHHLLLADTATRRDLADEHTVARFAAVVSDAAHDDLLYALTIGDSRATGPAAWNASKAALLRALYMKTDARFASDSQRGDASVDDRAELVAAELARHRTLLAAREVAVEWTDGPDGMLQCTVAAPDRTGLLAIVAATLALAGFDITGASAFSAPDGMALEVFTGRDRFGRLAVDERGEVVTTLVGALAGEIDLDARLAERTRRYRRPHASPAERDVRVLVDTEASTSATVVEVHAPDDVGLLARVAAVFGDLGLDVAQAIVSTLGDRVVDVFYLHDASGRALSSPEAIDAMRATLLARLTAAVTLD